MVKETKKMITREKLQKDIKAVGWKNSELKQVSIRDIKTGKVTLVPAKCQRQFCTKHSSKFVMALIYGNLGLVSASYYKKAGSLLDGQQRITSIVNFTNDAFALDLKKVDWISDEVKSSLNGCYFSELSQDIQDMILDEKVTVNCYKNLSPTSESNLYVLMNSSSTALSTIEIIKARYGELWETVDMLKNHAVFNHMRQRGRFVKEKNILELLCIFCEQTEKTKFTDNIDCLRNYLEKEKAEDEEFFQGTIDAFIEEMKAFNEIFVDDNNIFINNKMGDTTKKASYHFYDEKVAYYMFHTSCVRANVINKKKATTIREQAKTVHNKLFIVNPAGRNSYQYYSAQGNDTVSSMKAAAELISMVKDGAYESSLS